jgi:amino acid transporter
MSATRGSMTVRQAAFIGVGAMVGAGIFALLGEAGAVAGAAVWLSFLIAGAIAGLQGYSWAKLGTKFPSAGGLLEYVTRGFGDGHITGATCWLTFGSNVIVTALVSVSFGSYAASMFIGDDAAAWWPKVFAVALLIGMLWLNIVGSKAVARVQSLIVWVVVGALMVFSVITIWNIDLSLLSPSLYPGVREIVASVALTFFAFLGFGVVTFTARDLSEPARQLPRAMNLALAIATVTYVAVALGVFGTLTVDEVIDSGGTAIAVAAEPSLGQFGFWLMGLIGLFATAGATNSGIYPAKGLSEELSSKGQFPPVMGRSLGKVPIGMLIMVGLTVVLAVGFDLSAIANIGSAVALLIFSLVSVAHLRIRGQTGARLVPLILALLATTVTLVVFAGTTLAEEPAATSALIFVILVSIGIDLGWSRLRRHRGSAHGASPVPASG